MTRFSPRKLLKVLSQVVIVLLLAPCSHLCIFEFLNFVVEIVSFYKVLILQRQYDLFAFVEVLEIMCHLQFFAHSRLSRL